MFETTLHMHARTQWCGRSMNTHFQQSIHKHTAAQLHARCFVAGKRNSGKMWTRMNKDWADSTLIQNHTLRTQHYKQQKRFLYLPWQMWGRGNMKYVRVCTKCRLCMSGWYAHDDLRLCTGNAHITLLWTSKQPAKERRAHVLTHPVTLFPPVKTQRWSITACYWTLTSPLLRRCFCLDGDGWLKRWCEWGQSVPSWQDSALDCSEEEHKAVT